MTKISTSEKPILIELNEKLNAEIQNLKQHKPSLNTINTILSYSKVLKIEPSEYIEHIITVKN